MVVQVKKKVLVLDQPFLQPDAVYRVEVLEGLDGVHGSAFHLTHRNQPIRPKVGFSSQSLARMVIRAGRFIVSRTFPANRPSEDSGSLPVTLGKAWAYRLSVMVAWAWPWRSATKGRSRRCAFGSLCTFGSAVLQGPHPPVRRE